MNYEASALKMEEKGFQNLQYLIFRDCIRSYFLPKNFLPKISWQKQWIMKSSVKEEHKRFGKSPISHLPGSPPPFASVHLLLDNRILIHARWRFHYIFIEMVQFGRGLRYYRPKTYRNSKVIWDNFFCYFSTPHCSPPSRWSNSDSRQMVFSLH